MLSRPLHKCMASQKHLHSGACTALRAATVGVLASLMNRSLGAVVYIVVICLLWSVGNSQPSFSVSTAFLWQTGHTPSHIWSLQKTHYDPACDTSGFKGSLAAASFKMDTTDCC